jgi:hypothetical protein
MSVRFKRKLNCLNRRCVKMYSPAMIDADPEALHRGLEIGKSQPWSKVGNFECMSCRAGNANRFSHSLHSSKWLHRINRSLFRTFASQIRVFAFLHRYFMDIFSGTLYFRTIWLNSLQFCSAIMKSNSAHGVETVGRVQNFANWQL